MQSNFHHFQLGEVIPPHELLDRIGLLFERFSYETCMLSIWEVLQEYRIPRFPDHGAMVRDEKMQVFIYVLDLLADLHKTWSEESSSQRYPVYSNVVTREPMES